MSLFYHYFQVCDRLSRIIAFTKLPHTNSFQCVDVTGLTVRHRFCHSFRRAIAH
ncbi:hypothetical protein ACF3DV_12490 [Chlorogloeopsis fritschii PCC 9212]|uniref:hypothetical protein n=1 Tax=Chlorogloeopsis fritschii TaxID=1124 RepID=UPI0002FEB218|nr:hypothetical protein [Chlorogloeopsis fritschii]